MKYKSNLILLLGIILYSVNWLSASSKLKEAIIIDHNCVDLSQIPESEIINAKNILHIAYGHTSHGSQLITGMDNLDVFMGGNGLYVWNDGPKNGYLDIDDKFRGGDLGHNGSLAWENSTREYLNNSANSDVNVIIWSWCGGCSDNTTDGIQIYLDAMNQLEQDYPNINFVYMTGHRDIWADEILKRNNQQIRDYCIANNKILYDYADIESHDPDGTYCEFANDNCDYYDSDFNKLGNWATEWQNSHTEGVDWYNCSSAHSEPLNANRKAYAAWWLWARLAGWDGETSLDTSNNEVINSFMLYQNYPNPFNPKTTIRYTVPDVETLHATSLQLKIYDILGNEITTLVDELQPPGAYKIDFNAKELPSGMYIYRLKTGNKQFIKRMMLIK